MHAGAHSRAQVHRVLKQGRSRSPLLASSFGFPSFFFFFCFLFFVSGFFSKTKLLKRMEDSVLTPPVIQVSPCGEFNVGGYNHQENATKTASFTLQCDAAPAFAMPLFRPRKKEMIFYVFRCGSRTLPGSLSLLGNRY